MNKIFYGLIFVALSFYITIGDLKIDFMPDFIGFILLYLGIKELSERIMDFKKLIPVSLFLIIFSIGYVVINVIGIEINTNILFVFNLLMSIAFIYLLHSVICGIKYLEKEDDLDYGACKLYKVWLAYLIVIMLSLIPFFVPEISSFVFIINLVLGLMFLLMFRFTKNLYESYH